MVDAKYVYVRLTCSVPVAALHEHCVARSFCDHRHSRPCPAAAFLKLLRRREDDRPYP
jgi:hypothetical protein